MEEEAKFIIKVDKDILSIIKRDDYNKNSYRRGISIFKKTLEIYELNEQNINNILNSQIEDIIYSFANIGFIFIKDIIFFAFCTEKDIIQRGKININNIFQITNISYIIITPDIDKNKKDECLNFMKAYTIYEITKGLFFSTNLYKLELSFDNFYNNLYNFNKDICHMSPTINFCYNYEHIEYFKKFYLDDFITHIIYGYYNNNAIRDPIKEGLNINLIIGDKEMTKNENDKIIKQIEIILSSNDLALNQIFHFLFFCYIGDFLSEEKFIYNLLKKEQPEDKVDNGSVIIIDIKNKTKGKNDEEINEIISNIKNKLNKQIGNNNKIIFIKQRDPINNIIEKNKDIFNDIKFNYVCKNNYVREFQEKQLLIITDNEMNYLNIIDNILYRIKYKFIDNKGELLYESEINEHIKTLISNYRNFIKTKNNELLKIEKIQLDSLNKIYLNNLFKIKENQENQENNININKIVEEKRANEKKEENNKFSIFIVTSNVACYNLENENDVEESLKKLLFPNQLLSQFSKNNYPTFYCVGLQEIVKLNTSNVIFLKNKKNAAKLWEQKITALLNKKYNYKLQFREDLVGIFFLFFVKTSESKYIGDINKDIIKAGFLNTLGNKGYIIYDFKYKNKSFTFCTGHLQAGEKDKNYQSRVDQLVDILIYKNNKNPNRIFQNDFYFLFGDMNFRVKIDHKKFLEDINKIKGDTDNKIKDDTNIKNKLFLIEDLLTFPKKRDKKRELVNSNSEGNIIFDNNNTIKNKNKDEDEDDIDSIELLSKSNISEEQFKIYFLKKHLENEELTLIKKYLELYQINEHQINFLPTYKYIKGFNFYNVSKRIPSWTDRILFKKTKEIKCICYDKMDVKYSDHRPVFAIFEINMNKQ